MTPVVVTSSLAGLACPGEPDGNGGVAGAAAGGVPAGNVTGPGSGNRNDGNRSCRCGAVETLGAGATPPEQRKPEQPRREPSLELLPPELPQSGLPLPAWPRPKVHGAGATIGVVATRCRGIGNGWRLGFRGVQLVHFFVQSCEGGGLGRSIGGGNFLGKIGVGGAVEVGAALAGATAAGILVAGAAVAEAAVGHSGGGFSGLRQRRPRNLYPAAAGLPDDPTDRIFAPAPRARRPGQPCRPHGRKCHSQPGRRDNIIKVPAFMKSPVFIRVCMHI